MAQLRDIKGFEGLYAITRAGRVWSAYKDDFLKEGVTQLQLWDELGRVHYKRVARVVAETWLPGTPHLDHIVFHKDGDPSNNHVSNLYWGNPVMGKKKIKYKHGKIRQWR